MTNPINGHDLSRKDGSTEVAVGDENGRVIWRFPRPISWAALDPQNAFQIAEATARAAHRAKFGTEPPSDGSYLGQQIRARLTENLRDRMVVRAMHIIRNLQDRGKSPEFVAKELVDTIFAEVDR